MSDLIDRQAAIDGLDGHYIERVTLNDWQAGWNAALDWVGEIYLDELPSAQPERKTGEWIQDNNSVYEMRFVCSSCKESMVVPIIGFTKYVPIWDFCPNCGADMRGERNETD